MGYIRVPRRTPRQTLPVTSALLFVALLVVVDLSYRRWMRRSIARRTETRRAERTISLDPPHGAVVEMQSRRAGSHDGPVDS